MPRVARIVIAGQPHHVVQRGNNRQDVFFVDDDRRALLRVVTLAVAALLCCGQERGKNRGRESVSGPGCHRRIRTEASDWNLGFEAGRYTRPRKARQWSRALVKWEMLAEASDHAVCNSLAVGRT